MGKRILKEADLSFKNDTSLIPYFFTNLDMFKKNKIKRKKGF